MSEKEYIIPYNKEARKRHYHKTVKGKVKRFVVQLEVEYNGMWKEVVRYDCAHGFAHRDAYNLQGKHIKDELHLSFEDALTLADEDIDDKWEYYKRIFLEGGMP